jgi:NitT/TauT family transport system ATP-binding protein
MSVLRRTEILRTARSRTGARKVGLHPNDLDKYPLELSGGKRQRAALAVDPNVSFFDEPFTAVDVGLKRVLQNLVIAAAAR